MEYIYSKTLPFSLFDYQPFGVIFLCISKLISYLNEWDLNSLRLHFIFWYFYYSQNLIKQNKRSFFLFLYYKFIHLFTFFTWQTFFIFSLNFKACGESKFFFCFNILNFLWKFVMMVQVWFKMIWGIEKFKDFLENK